MMDNRRDPYFPQALYACAKTRKLLYFLTVGGHHLIRRHAAEDDDLIGIPSSP